MAGRARWIVVALAAVGVLAVIRFTNWFEAWYWATLVLYVVPLTVALGQLVVARLRHEADAIDFLIWIVYVVFVPFGWLMWFWRNRRTGYGLDMSPHHVSDPPLLRTPGRR